MSDLLRVAEEVVAGVEYVGPHGATTQLSRETWDWLAALADHGEE